MGHRTEKGENNFLIIFVSNFIAIHNLLPILYNFFIIQYSSTYLSYAKKTNRIAIYFETIKN